MPTLHVVGAAILRDHCCLVAQRGPHMSLPGKWEVPGGKVEPAEHPGAALAREITEELGLHIAVGDLLATGTAALGPRTIRLDVYAATITSGVLSLREHAQINWATAADLAQFDWAEADIPCVPHVQRWMHASVAASPAAPLMLCCKSTCRRNDKLTRTSAEGFGLWSWRPPTAQRLSIELSGARSVQKSA